MYLPSWTRLAFSVMALAVAFPVHAARVSHLHFWTKGSAPYPWTAFIFVTNPSSINQNVKVRAVAEPGFAISETIFISGLVCSANVCESGSGQTLLAPGQSKKYGVYSAGGPVVQVSISVAEDKGYIIANLEDEGSGANGTASFFFNGGRPF